VSRTPTRTTRWLIYAGLLIAAVVALYPVMWVVTMALSPGQGFNVGVVPIPTTVSFDNIREVVSTSDAEGWLFGRQLFNSLVVSSATAFVGLVFSTSAAYALSRFDFPGKDRGLAAFLVTQMFPGVVMMIPLYLILDLLNLLDNLGGLVLVYATTAIPFSVFTLKGYFDTIPRELEEAAMLDGASRIRTFFTVILPLVKPAIAVTGLFSFMTAWNEFILAATLISDPRALTLPVVLQRYVDDYGTEWGLFAAGALIVSLPVVLLFFALQKHFVAGLTAGSVKG
jgi:arabinogalactan oligomer/maltooligosaccharide transport system permease protein